ncbi:MAG: RNA 2'-phosphotransferase [Pseudopedobacter saltans]|uniref:Probable RNA 2'-phosphotransferase n=1 Tax=Pseudopedobacter saltans TaxID=151895 RepID=A0A2W5F157_9SPHI|nr:MAG: RNA 2'-phosphotransferase [Pseudopedobacter saltans]
MAKGSDIEISKFLSLVLRHKPETIGINLDHGGWTDVSILMEKINQKGFSLDLEMLVHIVATNPKKRFILNDDNSLIRANQGHSLDVDLGLQPLQPPPILYHGTAVRFLNAILIEGLNKQQRQHVHLSKDMDVALNVGARHGKPIVLEVNAGQMYQDQFSFFLSDNGVWLTDHVPIQYIRIMDENN